jgi:hypothetical protein
MGVDERMYADGRNGLAGIPFFFHLKLSQKLAVGFLQIGVTNYKASLAI